jgi:hypothetical protein
MPHGAISTIATLSPGTYTIYMSYNVSGTNARFAVSDAILYAYEL